MQSPNNNAAMQLNRERHHDSQRAAAKQSERAKPRAPTTTLPCSSPGSGIARRSSRLRQTPRARHPTENAAVQLARKRYCKAQQQVASNTKSSEPGGNAAMQLNMGEGKSTVIIPMAAAPKHEGAEPADNAARTRSSRYSQPVDLLNELNNPGYTTWNLYDRPEYLLMEIESGIMIRKVQQQIASRIESPESEGNAVMQLNMDGGKSAVMIPMIHKAAALTNGLQLVRVAVAKPQAKQTAEMLFARVDGLLGRRVYSSIAASTTYRPPDHSSSTSQSHSQNKWQRCSSRGLADSSVAASTTYRPLGHSSWITQSHSQNKGQRYSSRGLADSSVAASTICCPPGHSSSTSPPPRQC
jgi:hypothetical protein